MLLKKHGDELARLLLRLAVGGLLLPHGLGKLFGWFGGPGIMGFQAELAHFGLPSHLALAWLLAGVQTVGAGLLVVGLWTRASAVIVAAFLLTTVVLNLPNGWFWMARGIEYPVLWTAAALCIALLGAGRWSIDAQRAKAP